MSQNGAAPAKGSISPLKSPTMSLRLMSIAEANDEHESLHLPAEDTSASVAPEAPELSSKQAAPPALLRDEPVVSMKHYDALVEELKCPGCAYPMKPPILLCKRGHSICAQCTRILLMCPLCKESFTSARSLTVEAVCSKAHFRCSNSGSGGCTVRMPLALLAWHESQCVYKPMKCFMGRVWGDCKWAGREIEWKAHLEAEHRNRTFVCDSVELIWNMNVHQRSLTGYYVFQVHDEMFNFYEINDKDRVLFTMTCTSPIKEKKYGFGYELTITHPYNEALAITHKYPVHSEYDSDILQDGTCVCISIADLYKFMDCEEKLLHYRIRVLAVNSPRRRKNAASPTTQPLPLDCQQTEFEGVNVKNVPSDVIITRHTESGGLPLSPTQSGSASSTETPDTPDSERRQWGTPQLNFNRRYLNRSPRISLQEPANEEQDDGELQQDDKCSIRSTSTSYTKKVSSTLRRSFRALKTDFIDKKSFSSKKSPEKSAKNE